MKFRSTLLLLICLAIPLGLSLAWHWYNQFYPRHDAAQYLVTAQSIYLAFKNDGVLSGLHAAYFERSRPILHPVFLAVFLSLTGGKVLATVALANGILLVIFWSCAYAIARMSLGLVRAAILAVLVTTFPAALAVANTGLSEPWFLASCAISALCFVRARWLTSKKWSLWFGLALGLCFCIRPVETLVVSFVPIALAVWAAWRQGLVRKGEVFSAVFALVLTGAAGIFIVRGEFGWTEPQTARLVPFVLLLWGLSVAWVWRGYRGFSAVFLGFMVCFALSMSWLLPFMSPLYDWATVATWGNVTQLNGGRTEASAWLFPIRTFTELGRYGFPILAVGALITLFVSRSEVHSSFRSQLKWIVTCAWFVCAPPALAALSYNWDPRYYVHSYALFTGLCAAFCLRPGVLLGELRGTLVGLALCAHVFAFTELVWGPLELDGSSTEEFNPRTFLMAPPYRPQDPMQMGRRALEEWFSEQGYERARPISIGVVPTVTHQDIDYSYNVLPLTLISRERGLAWRIKTPWVPSDISESRFSLLVKETAARNSILLVGPLDGEYEAILNESSRLGVFLIQQWKANKLDEFGYREMGQLEVSDRRGKRHQVLILKSLGSDIGVLPLRE